MVLLVLLCPIPFNIFLPFSDFHRAPGNDHFFSANTAVIKRMSNHEIYRWSVYDSLSTSRSTNCTLLVYSINTDCSTTKFMKLGVSKLPSQTHYCVIVWVVMNFVKYCDRECYCFIINMLFQCCSVSLDTCTIMHKVSVFFHYCIMYQSFTNIIVHSQAHSPQSSNCVY